MSTLTTEQKLNKHYGTNYPLIDASDKKLSIYISPNRCSAGERSNPFTCPATLGAGGALDTMPAIYRTIACFLQPVSKADARWNKKHNGIEVEPGTMAWHEYTNSKPLREQIRRQDAGEDFIPGMYDFLPKKPSQRRTRDHADATRTDRNKGNTTRKIQTHDLTRMSHV